MSGRNDSFICYLPNFPQIPQHHRQMPEYQSSQCDSHIIISGHCSESKTSFLDALMLVDCLRKQVVIWTILTLFSLLKKLLVYLLACLFICCIYVCVWCMHMCTCMCMTKCTCGGQRITLGLRPCMPTFWNQGLFVFSVVGHIPGLLVVKFLGGDSPVFASHFTVVSLRQQTCTAMQSWRFEHRSSCLCGKTLSTGPSL